MADAIAEAFVKVTPDTKGFNEKLQKGVEDAGSGLSSAFKKIAGIAAAAFAGAKIIGFGKDAVAAASDMAESVSKVNVVFGESAGAMQDWAKSAATNLGQSNQQALEAVGTFGNLFQAFGLAREPAADMSKGLVQLAADLASFNNASPEDTLLALRSGLSGETEPLKRFGVALSQDRIELEAVSMGLIKNTKEALTPAQKAQAAYALIMKDTTLAQGDFARTSDGLANKQRILSAKIADTKARLGAALLPVVLKITSVFADKLLPVLEKAGMWLGDRLPKAVAFLKPWVELIITGFKALVGAFINTDRTSDGFVGVMERIGIVLRRVWDTIVSLVVPVFHALVAAGKAVGQAIADIVGWFNKNRDVAVALAAVIGAVVTAMIAMKIIGTVSKALQAMRAAVLAVNTAMAANPVLLIVAALAALAAAVFIAYKRFEGFRNVVDAVGRFFRDVMWPVLRAVFQGIIVAAQEVVGWFARNWDDIANIIKEVARVIGKVLSVVADIFRTAFVVAVEVVKRVIGVILDLWDRFGGALMRYIGAAWETVSGVFRAAFDVLVGIFEFFKDLFTGKWGQLWGDVVGIFSAIWDGIKAIFQGAVDGLLATLTMAWEAIKLAISLAWEGIKALFPLIWEGIKLAFQAGIDGIVALLGLAWDGIKAAASLVWEGIKNRIGLVWDGIKAVVQLAIDAIVGFVLGIPDRIASIVSTLWDGIKTGITAAKDWVGDRITDLVEYVLGIPGRIARTVETLWDGLKTGISAAKDWVGDRINEVVTFVTGIPGRIAGTVSHLWDDFKQVITDAKQWVSDKIDEVVGFATKLPGRMKGIFTGMWDGIKDGFKGVINAIIRFWNGLEFSLPKVGPFGGWTIGTPDITEMRAAGGPVSARRGYITSELGPELFVPRSSGFMVSNADLHRLLDRQAEPAVLPETMTLIIEGTPFRAILQQHDQAVALALAAGRRN